MRKVHNDFGQFMRHFAGVSIDPWQVGASPEPLSHSELLISDTTCALGASCFLLFDLFDAQAIGGVYRTWQIIQSKGCVGGSIWSPYLRSLFSRAYQASRNTRLSHGYSLHINSSFRRCQQGVRETSWCLIRNALQNINSSHRMRQGLCRPTCSVSTARRNIRCTPCTQNPATTVGNVPRKDMSKHSVLYCRLPPFLWSIRFSRILFNNQITTLPLDFFHGFGALLRVWVTPNTINASPIACTIWFTGWK